MLYPRPGWKPVRSGRTPPAFPRKIVGPEKEAVQVDSLWYWVVFATVPEPTVERRLVKGELRETVVHHHGIDFVTGQTASAGRYRAGKRQMAAYAEDSTVLWPEMITLFATKSLQALAMTIAQSPEQFGWLLTWQQQKFPDTLPDAQQPYFNAFLGPLVRENFIAQPSSGPAFVQLAAQFFDAHAQNAKRLPELKALDVPVKLIWGRYDPYITVAVAERRQSQLKHASLTVVPAGHWLQVDEPEKVAKAMLS